MIVNILGMVAVLEWRPSLVKIQSLWCQPRVGEKPTHACDLLSHRPKNLTALMLLSYLWPELTRAFPKLLPSSPLNAPEFPLSCPWALPKLPPNFFWASSQLPPNCPKLSLSQCPGILIIREIVTISANFTSLGMGTDNPKKGVPPSDGNWYLCQSWIHHSIVQNLAWAAGQTGIWT